MENNNSKPPDPSPTVGSGFSYVNLYEENTPAKTPKIEIFCKFSLTSHCRHPSREDCWIAEFQALPGIRMHI